MEAEDLKAQLGIIVRAMVKEIDITLHKREAAEMKRKLSEALRDLADSVSS